MDGILVASFLLGLTSNIHCIGMCGPIAMAVPVDRSSTLSILKGITAYNAGRVLTYGVLGFLIGIIGLTINTLGILQWFSIISGIMLIAYAWRKWIFRMLFNGIQVNGIQPYVVRSIGKLIGSNLAFKSFLLGMLNGLLPCGMVYLALINSLLTGAPDLSAFSMMSFGIATLPAMIAVGLGAHKMSQKLRNNFSNSVPYLLTLVGLLIILRGLNLAIPYLSPKVEIVQTKNHYKNNVSVSCCHKQTNE